MGKEKKIDLDHDSLPPQDFRKQVDSELLPQFKKYPFKGKNYERNQLLKVRAFD